MLLRITALAVAASAMAAPSPALRVAALAAVTTATGPPFATSKELRPAARRTKWVSLAVYDDGAPRLVDYAMGKSERSSSSYSISLYYSVHPHVVTTRLTRMRTRTRWSAEN